MFIPGRAHCLDIFLRLHSLQAGPRAGPPDAYRTTRFSRLRLRPPLFRLFSFPSTCRRARGTPTISEVLAAAKCVIDRSLDSDHLRGFSLLRERIDAEYRNFSRVLRIPFGTLRLKQGPPHLSILQFKHRSFELIIKITLNFLRRYVNLN